MSAPNVDALGRTDDWSGVHAVMAGSSRDRSGGATTCLQLFGTGDADQIPGRVAKVRDSNPAALISLRT